MTDCLLGADVGGTSTRVAVADRSGTVLGIATEAAGNPNAVGIATSADRIRSAAVAALQRAGRSPADIGSVLLGMAGFATARDAVEDFGRLCLPDGVTARPRYISDLGVAFASGTHLPQGYVIIGGTGSSAARIDRGEIVIRRGGWGWLTGDEGAGFWLGREAVRHALSQVERGLPRSPLTRRVLTELADWLEPTDSDAPPAEDLTLLLRAPYRRDPVRLADLAPAVTELVDQDPAAVAIAARAAELLVRLVLDLDPVPGLPVVTTGSVLHRDGPVSRAFSERIALALQAPVRQAGSGLVGALWLAAQTGSDGLPTDPSIGPDPAVHQRLQASVATAA